MRFFWYLQKRTWQATKCYLWDDSKRTASISLSRSIAFTKSNYGDAILDDYILGPSESKEAKTPIPWSKVVYPSLEMIFISTMTSKRIILQGTTISHTYLQSFLAWTMLLGKENMDPIFKSSLFSSSPQFLREFSWTKILSAKQSNQLTFKGCCIVTLPRNHTN